MKSESVVGRNVFSFDGKKIGKVIALKRDHLLAYRKGLLTEEQFRIPTSTIIEDSKNVHDSITINLTEDQLKHGYVFLEGNPNSGVIHGLTDSEPKFNSTKQVQQYSPAVSANADNSLTIGSRPVPAKEGQIKSTSAYYSCDICPSKFSTADQLQRHRADVHRAATDI